VTQRGESRVRNDRWTLEAEALDASFAFRGGGAKCVLAQMRCSPLGGLGGKKDSLFVG